MTTIDRAIPYAPERDLGTPAPPGAGGVDPRTVTLTIDGLEVTVPEGSLLVLGDNRANSADSVVSCRGRAEADGCARFVREDQVVGPVIARFWPPTAIGGVGG